MHTKTHIRTLMHGYEHRHKQVYTRWNKKVRFATNQHVLRSWTRTAKRMYNQWNAAFAETVREAGNGPGSKGAGGGVAKSLCQFRLYTPITPHLPTLPQLNISYGGNRLCHLWQRSRLGPVLLGDSDRIREYCNMALNVVHNPLLPWSTNGIIANYNSSPSVAPTRCILRRLSLLCKSGAWHPCASSCACVPLELCICLRLRHNRIVISVSRRSCDLSMPTATCTELGVIERKGRRFKSREST